MLIQVSVYVDPDKTVEEPNDLDGPFLAMQKAFRDAINGCDPMEHLKVGHCVFATRGNGTSHRSSLLHDCHSQIEEAIDLLVNTIRNSVQSKHT